MLDALRCRLLQVRGGEAGGREGEGLGIDLALHDALCCCLLQEGEGRVGGQGRWQARTWVWD